VIDEKITSDGIFYQQKILKNREIYIAYSLTPKNGFPKFGKASKINEMPVL
jgi:hypothetical protein